MNETFHGFGIFDLPAVDYFDWMLLLLNGKSNQKVAITAVTLYDYCQNASKLFHTTCLQTMLKGGIPDDYYAGRDAIIALTNRLDLTSSFKGIFSTLWHGTLPCYDTLQTRPSTLHNNKTVFKRINLLGLFWACET